MRESLSIAMYQKTRHINQQTGNRLFKDDASNANNTVPTYVTFVGDCTTMEAG